MNLHTTRVTVKHINKSRLRICFEFNMYTVVHTKPNKMLTFSKASRTLSGMWSCSILLEMRTYNWSEVINGWLKL